MEKDTEDMFFVEVRESNEVRRYILESLKNIVEGLQRFEKFKAIRKERTENINKLRNVARELNKLTSDLKKSLPETKLRIIKIETSPIEKKTKLSRKTKQSKKIKEVEEKSPVSELEKLESELKVVEEKLLSLR